MARGIALGRKDVDLLSDGIMAVLEDNHQRFTKATELEDQPRMIEFCKLIGELHGELILVKDILQDSKKNRWLRFFRR